MWLYVPILMLDARLFGAAHPQVSTMDLKPLFDPSVVLIGNLRAYLDSRLEALHVLDVEVGVLVCGYVIDYVFRNMLKRDLIDLIVLALVITTHTLFIITSGVKLDDIVLFPLPEVKLIN